MYSANFVAVTEVVDVIYEVGDVGETEPRQRCDFEYESQTEVWFRVWGRLSRQFYRELESQWRVRFLLAVPRREQDVRTQPHVPRDVPGCVSRTCSRDLKRIDLNGCHNISLVNWRISHLWAYVNVKKSIVFVSMRSLVWIDTHFVNHKQERKTIIVSTCISLFF